MRHELKLLIFLAYVACSSNIQAAPETSLANAFSSLKGKLQAGKDGVLFINGDSTSYSEYGPYYKFAQALGEATGCTVILHRWAEWVVSAPKGPKEYAQPVILHQGGSQAKLEVYLASLPGAVAGDMFSGSRRTHAMGAIPRPDCAILHHGHNMVNCPVAFKGDPSSGRGLFLASIAQTSMQWPGVPQAIVTQNPWRDGDQYARIYDVLRGLAAEEPQLTLIDSCQRFIAAGKRADLYRDTVHPSDRKDHDAGAKMVADALLDAWREAKPGAAFSTPGWQERRAANLIGNGEFADWKAGLPAGWHVGGAATAEKSTDAPHGGEPFALAVRPNGDKGAFLGKVLDAAESAAVRGKTITLAALVHASPAQPRAYAAFVCPVEGVNRTFAFGDLNSGKGDWVWMVCSGIPVDAAAANGSMYLRFFPAFGLNAPTNNEPLLIQRVLVVEGKKPAGLPKEGR
jgi:hypothetical protein